MSSKDDDDDDDDESSSDGPRLAPEDGLSRDVLAALWEFQAGGFADDEMQRITKDTVCAAYRPEDTAIIAETLRRLSEREQQQQQGAAAATDDDDDAVVATERIVEPLQVPCNDDNDDDDSSNATGVLVRDGVVRINHVLTAELCDACLHYINESLAHSSSTANDDGTAANGGFGNVFERQNRFDMYLRPTGVVEQALSSMLGQNAPLGRLFQQLVAAVQSGPQDGALFHELSSLVADPGCVAQPIHPDSPYSVEAPLWTVFVALQDIAADMGGTVVLPGTHTESCHAQLKSPDRFRLLKHCQYKRADLHKGDCIVMDARTFHYGGANLTVDSRRVLLYFTIRNPAHTGAYPGCGSLFPDLDGVLTSGRFA